MRTRSKLLPILLSLVLAVSMCPAPAFATDLQMQGANLATQATGSYGVNLGSAAYTSANPYYPTYNGECTWYAWGRAYEKLGVALPFTGNANDWTSLAASRGYATGTEARANSIMVEHYSGTGHVFFVESVANGYAYVSEGNYLGSYHEDAINLTTNRRTSDPGTQMGSIDYIYLSGSNDNEPHDDIWLDADGWYEFAPKCAPNRRLNIAGGSKDNGGNANIYIANDTAGQNFYVRGTTVGSYCILPKCSNKLLDLQWNSSEPGTNVFQWEDTGGTGQRWVFLDAGDGYVYIKANNGLFLDVDSEVDANDTNVKGWSYNGSDGQKWRMIRTSGSANKWGVAPGSYVIQSATGSRVLDLPGGYTDNGTNVQIYERNGSPAQTFEIAWDDKAELYTIKQKASGRSLDTAANANGVANVILYDYNAANGQRWFIEDAGGGYVYIRNRWGYYLDVDDGKDANGTNVKVFNYDGYKAQKWKLIAVQDISSATVTVPDQTYTGKALTPAPTVKVGSATLASGTDYTVSYKNNTAVGTATVTVSGKGAYTGTKTATFKIAAPAQTKPTDPAKPTSIASATVTGVKSKTYTGKALAQSPTVKVGGKTLKAGPTTR